MSGRDGTHTLPPRELREVARARQRLRDRRAEALPFELTPARIRSDLRRRTPASCADGILLLSEPDEPRLRRAAADLQPRRLGGRAVGQRRPRGRAVPPPARLDRPATHSRSRPPPARSDRRSPRRRRARVDMGRARLRSDDFPSGRRQRRRRADRRRTQLALSARPGRQSAVRYPRRRRARARRARPAGASVRRSSTTSCSRTARTCPGTRCKGRARIRARIFERGVGETSASGTGATGAAVAHVLERRRRRSPSCSTGASSRSKWTRTCRSS